MFSPKECIAVLPVIHAAIDLAGPQARRFPGRRKIVEWLSKQGMKREGEVDPWPMCMRALEREELIEVVPAVGTFAVTRFEHLLEMLQNRFVVRTCKSLRRRTRKQKSPKRSFRV